MASITDVGPLHSLGPLDVDISHEPVLTQAEYCSLLEGVVLTNAQVGDEETTLRWSAAAPN
jgi:hypothetical protein